MIRLRLALTLLAFVLAALPARAFETAATAAWVYDMTTGTVLMDKNAEWFFDEYVGFASGTWA